MLNILTALIVFVFLFVLGSHYLAISFRTRSVRDVQLHHFPIFTRWAIRKSLPQSDTHYGLYRFMIGIVGIAFIITPFIVCVVEIKRALGTL
ncbi:hypothetical protein [Shimazuella kribbensis]|uniref:hypothetical protein n=1 Tax=Shimazuella kribbensis TaxID=139808 RepID=UPI0004122070|nr:hypothetical protein [Shimazuella kribbensis]